MSKITLEDFAVQLYMQTRFGKDSRNRLNAMVVAERGEFIATKTYSVVGAVTRAIETALPQFGEASWALY